MPKPSSMKFTDGRKACTNCRKRRIKVVKVDCKDQVNTRLTVTNLQCSGPNPPCLQCIRLDLACGGFRTDLDLMFVHQTDALSRKFKPQRAPKAQQNRLSEFGHLHHGRQKSPLHFHRLSDASYIDSVAKNAYLERFSFWTRDPHARPPENIVAEMKESALLAVGFAVLARSQKEVRILKLARVKYQLGLNILRRIIQDSQEEKQQDNLAAINKMAMFEVRIVASDAHYGFPVG